ELSIVMMVRSVLEFARSAIFHGDLDAALSLVSDPHSVVKAELHLLIDVSGEVVRRYPACVDVESGLAAIVVAIDHLQLNRVPGGLGGGSHQAALSRGGNPGKAAGEGTLSEREVDQLDVMHRHVGSRIATGNPLGELLAADRLRLQQRAVAVVDVPQDAIGNV